MKVAIQTLGCKVNQSESSYIEATLRENDIEIVGPSDDPDVCIINTCTVTAKSDYQSRQLVRRAVKAGAKVIATGCYAQLKPGELLKIEGLNLVVGNSGKDALLDHLRNLPGTNAESFVTEIPRSPLKKTPYHSSRSRAFLKIQDGCSFSCSYCAVPKARGRSRSLKKEDVISSAGALVKDGYNEIVITGVHIGSYGLDLKPSCSLFEIIDILSSEYVNTRFRLSSIEPREITDDLISILGRQNICKHLHIPLQSGSDRILMEMRRGYTTDYYKHLINNIITAYPDVSIGTDLIAGYPGESDNDFDLTVNFIKQLPISYIHAFPYSKRPGTSAALSNEQIGEKTKKDRLKTIMEISREMKLNYMSRFLGSSLNVIVEAKSSNNSLYKAISDNYLRLLVQSDSLVPGQILRVRVNELTEKGLFAQPL